MQETATLSDWKTSSGVHSGTTYRVDHPAGWELHNLPTAAIVSCDGEPNALVSVLWIQRMGGMDPGSLLNEILQYNGIVDAQVLRATPARVVGTPLGSFREMEQEAQFTYRGELCRAVFYIHINDAVPPLLLFSSGSIVWLQAPARRWDEYRPTLERIASSFKADQKPA